VDDLDADVEADGEGRRNEVWSERQEKQNKARHKKNKTKRDRMDGPVPFDPHSSASSAVCCSGVEFKCCSNPIPRCSNGVRFGRLELDLCMSQVDSRFLRIVDGLWDSLPRCVETHKDTTSVVQLKSCKIQKKNFRYMSLTLTKQDL